MEFVKFYLFFLITAFAVASVSAKKKDPLKWVQAIDNLKSFKKLLRTKTNVMVMFASNEKSAQKNSEIYGATATEVKGSATLAWVDCSTKEGKKLCKKQKAAVNPIQLQHYKDGEFNAIYERKFTVKSMKAFLKDPKSDGPWEEEDDAQDVVHIDSEKQLNKLIKKNTPMLVMFYAPWCGYCKRFKPVFAEAATELKGSVIMAGVDAENNKDSASIRQTYNITGFPKSIYFNKGVQKFEYSAGHTKQELVDWLNDPQAPKPKEPEVEWAESETDVDHLTDETFDQFIADNQKVMVFFYAPWCGHCKRLKPDWDLAATQLKEEEAPEKLAALDAQKYKSIGDRFKVTGYPTIIYFENGEQKFDASSAFTRTKDGIVAYIKDPKEPPPPEKAWSETESDVAHYDDASFKAAVKKKKHVLVMFYAPWCGHCKKAKPEYQNAAAKFADDNKVVFGAVDCTISKSVCDIYDVKGFPTFYYISYGKNPAKYQGGREESEFVEFIQNKERESPESDTANEFEFWEGIPDAELLHYLTDTTWSDFVHANERVLVAVYRESCPNCQAIRSHFAEAAKLAKDEKLPVELAVIDSDEFGDDIYRMWTPDMGVPTLFWYERGVRRYEYTKSRASRDLIEFLRNPKKPEMKETYPDWSMQDSAEDIYHLEDNGFESFAKDQEDMMVMFYSDTCSICFQARGAYEEAAKRLDDERPEATLAAVNLAKAQKLKAKHDISSFPFYAYFRNGQLKYQYNGKPTTEAIVEFMKKPAFIPKPKAEESWTEAETNVTQLTKQTFRKFVKKHADVIVMFYAPWCGHCKRFKPDYTRAADLLVEQGSSAQLAAINGEKAKKLMAKHEVSGFPTLLYFKKGKFDTKYTGPRNTDGIVKFLAGCADRDSCDVDDVTASLGGKPPRDVTETDDDDIGGSKPNAVESLNPINLEDFVNGVDTALVMFYSPDCGACKTAKTPFFQAAMEAKEEFPDTKFALFNARNHQEFLKDFEIRGYPTFWYFEDGEKQFKYHGERTKRDFLQFIQSPVQKEDPRPRDSTAQWISESSHVEHLNRDNFDKFLRRNKHVMVFFYINMCKLCLDVIKPQYTEAAERLKDDEVPSKLAAVNGDWEKPVVEKYGVDTYPTFIYFYNGNRKYDYQGARQSNDFYKFMKSPREGLAKRTKPPSWQDLPTSASEYVTHLGNATYDEFVQSKHSVLVMFHSLHFSRCVKAREELAKAAYQLSAHPDIALGAVDCHRSPEQGLVCYHLKIRKYPLFKYYQGGVFELDLQVDNAFDITSFLRRRSDESREPIDEADVKTGKDEL